MTSEPKRLTDEDIVFIVTFAVGFVLIGMAIVLFFSFGC